MRFGTLHWPAILFGAAAGLFTSMVLFAVLAGIGSNTGVQAILMLIGFFVAGVVAGRFTPSDPQIAGGAAALVLFFVLAVITIGGAGTNLLGVVVFGIGAAILGPIGGVVGATDDRSDVRHGSVARRYCSGASRGDGRGRSRTDRGKSGLHRAMTLGNTQAGRPDGQCNREQTADGRGSRSTAQARVKRWGKSPPAHRVTGVAR